MLLLTSPFEEGIVFADHPRYAQEDQWHEVHSLMLVGYHAPLPCDAHKLFSNSNLENEGKLRTIRLKARIIFTRHDVIMLWWVLDMTHRQTEEPGWNDHGISLARWDSLQTDYSGCRGLLVSCL